MKIFSNKSISLLLLISLIWLFFSSSLLLAETIEKSSPEPGVKSATQPSQLLPKGEQEKILSQIRQKYSRKQSYSGSFTQKTTYTDSNETTVSTGRIWIQGPDKMRWEYQSPEKQLLISDGKTIWYYTPDLNQVMVGKIKDIKEARVIVNLLARLKSEQRGFRLALSRSNSLITVALSPLTSDQAPAFQNLKIIFSAASLMLRETQMIDLFANTITIKYKWKSGPDPVMAITHFSFVPPTGCDVMPLGQ
jgi:outer membrane lipoprotein carrier protein